MNPCWGHRRWQPLDEWGDEVCSRDAALQEAKSMLQPQVSVLAGHTTSEPSESLIFTS